MAVRSTYLHTNRTRRESLPLTRRVGANGAQSPMAQDHFQNLCPN